MDQQLSGPVCAHSREDGANLIAEISQFVTGRAVDGEQFLAFGRVSGL